MKPPYKIDPKKVEKLAARGLTVKQIARSLGMGTTTVYERMRVDEELKEALQRGRASGLRDVANALFEGAVEGNTTAQIFYLKNRDPEKWRDRRDHQLTGEGGGAIKHEVQVNLVSKED